jgi:hypothetical protein
MNRLIYILLLILPFCVNAQTEAMYSQYLFNKLVLNPAYAGSREGVCAVLIYRNQWTGTKQKIWFWRQSVQRQTGHY